MKNEQLKKQIEEAFQEKNWKYTWNQKNETFLLETPQSKQPFEVSIPKLQQKLQDKKMDVEKAIDELVLQIEAVFQSMQQRSNIQLREKEKEIFPVMRSTSFPTETASGKTLVFDEHTAESRIFYAVDLGSTYTLIDSAMLEESGWSKQELKERALFNLRRLPNQAKQDIVAGNTYYFISTTDGYGASRILNQALLEEYAQKVEGDLCFAIPHQDVLVIADIRNETGYDVLGQLSFHFYAGGNMPITALPFDYKSGKLEPIFILAKRQPKS